MFDFLGNDLNGISIKTSGIIDRAKEQNYPFTLDNGVHVFKSPDGYNFYVTDSAEQSGTDPVKSVTINSNDLQKTHSYWTDLLKIQVENQSEDELVLSYGGEQTKLIFKKTGKTLVGNNLMKL